MYYPGCLTHFVLPDIEKNYLEIIKKIGIDSIFIPEFFCCGSPVYHAGYGEDFEDLKAKNLEFFRKYGVKKIITNCPGCYYTFKEKYGVYIQHITQVLMNHLNKFEKKFDEEITYHDPCHLGRYSGVYDEPRKILGHLGFKVVELPNTRERSMCCGAGSGLKTNNPKLSNKICRQLLSQVKTKKFITACQMCYRHFKENAPKGIEVLELSEVLV